MADGEGFEPVSSSLVFHWRRIFQKPPAGSGSPGLL